MALFSDEKLRYLRILGLKFDATEDDIKKTYKKLALQHHPDKCQSDPEATKRFQELSAAYYGLQRLKERETRASYCNCDHAHYHHGFDFDSDCSDYYDSDDEYSQFYFQDDDEELMDFFRKIFMDVFSEFVFKKKFQSKRKRPDTCTTEDTEEESFFEFLSRKFRSEGRSSTDDYILTEDDLKKFQSYDEWQKARDPSKPPNRCKRRAVQRSRKHQKEEQKQKNKKQRKNEQRRKEKELLEIRDQLLRTLDEKKEKQKKRQNAEPPNHKPSSEANHMKSRATKSPERLEIERQLAEAKRKEHELQENLRRLEAKEHKQEKKLRKSEKKKAKKQQTSTQDAPSLPSEQRSFPHKTFNNIDFVESKYGQKNITSTFGNKHAKQISKEERDKGLADLMDKVKRKQRTSDDGGSDATMPDVTAAIDKGQKGCVNVRPNDAPRSARRSDTPAAETTPETSLLHHHLDAYHELMKLQPRRHTEQQLREERLRIRDAQLRTQQSELERLRKNPSHDLFKDDLQMKRDELLQKQREKERLRNEEEAFELKKEAERQHSAPIAPVSRKYYESISYHEKQHKMEPHTPHRQTPRRTTRTPPLITTVENPIKREIPNRQSTWSRVVTSESPWGERTRKQLELKTMLPSNMDEEEVMLQQALTLSIQTAELDMQQRKWQEQLEQAEADRRIMETAHCTKPGKKQPAKRNKNSCLSEPAVGSSSSSMKYPLSDKFLVYPGAFVNQSSHNLDEFETRPSWCLPLNPKSETRKVCKPKPAKRDSWSLCPGKPTADDWSYSKSADTESTDSELEEYEYAVEERCCQFKSLVGNVRAGESSLHDSSCTNTQQEGVNRNIKSNRKADQEKKSLELITNTPWQNTNENSNNVNKDARNQVKANFSRDSSSRKESSDDWDVECQWKTEGPSYPLLKYKPRTDNRKSREKVNESSLPPKPLSLMRENCEPCTAEGTVQTEEQLTPKPIPVLLGDTLRSTSESPVKTDSQLQIETVGLASVVKIEAETNTDSLVESDLVPERHDCFTQTKVSSGFVGGFWDSASNNADKIPVPKQQRNILADQEVLKQIPLNGFTHSKEKDLKDRSSNRVPPVAPEPRTQKPENWDDNHLVSSLAELSVKNPATNRTETSITVNTGHEKTTIPRLPVIMSVLNDSQEQDQVPERMMTDDQKLSNHHYNVQQAEQTTQSSERNVSGSGPSEQSSQPGGLPVGLPQHLIQAYLQYVAQNETTPGQQQPTPHPAPANCVQGVASGKSSSEMTPGLPCNAPSAAYPLPGNPGYIPAMWSHLYPWMGPLIANPVMSHAMMPFCPPPVFTYSLQQQIKTQESGAKEVTSNKHQGIEQRSSINQVNCHPHEWDSGFGQQDPVSKSSGHQSGQCTSSGASMLDTDVENCSPQQTTRDGGGQQMGGVRQEKEHMVEAHQDILRCNVSQKDHSLNTGHEEPMNKGGVGQQTAMNGSGLGQQYKGGAGQQMAMNGSGLGHDKGGAGQQMAMNGSGLGQQYKGGVGRQMAMNGSGLGHDKGGVGQQMAMNGSGLEQQNRVYKGGFGEQNSVNEGGFGQQGMKYWLQQNQPSSEGNMNNSNLINREMTAPMTHSDEPCSSRSMRPNFPPRFQRQKRLELNKKIKTLIQEINKEQEDYKETEIVKEEDRISA
ncbi:uncharacterized protein LOC124285161 isoform X2 [Haliotis rubra]|uniref:uncharacterized protein LOC124285161 isoform X2 n=1 Tax=Haliotis rubra TaxID=36100 RepID=UPI001EE5963F|nr:uncharacterized protein LOC124285161 isoform X2 [Haliotis rubra]